MATLIPHKAHLNYTILPQGIFWYQEMSGFSLALLESCCSEENVTPSGWMSPFYNQKMFS